MNVLPSVFHKMLCYPRYLLTVPHGTSSSSDYADLDVRFRTSSLLLLRILRHTGGLLFKSLELEGLLGLG